MAKRMLIDATHPEETRVVVLNGSRLEEFDFETSTKKQIKGNIYLAKVTRVEPSLQAAFVEYGGNRHGFLAFNEIHPDYYRIPIADRQAALAAERAAERAADEREEAEREAEPATPESPPTTDENGWGDESSADRMAHTAPDDVIRSPVFEESQEPHSDAPSAAEETAPPTSETAADLPLPSFMAETVERNDEPLTEHPASEGEAGPARDEPNQISRDESIEPARDEQTEILRDEPIETVGGDEIEETARPRARPFRHYKIQEVIKRRQIMLVQVTKEERGNKGAALTTYLSLAGRYCVLMPNTPRGGGVSRKITNNIDRRRLKDLLSDLDMPEGMGVIVRTAGSERSKTEIKRDFEYLLRLWDEIRELTLKSTAPALIYEEGNLIKRSIRDLYARDLEEVIVDGDEGYRNAKAFMKMLMPSHAKRVKPYRDPSVPLFHRFQVEGQIDAIHSPVVQLRSGGYIVINPTEALVAIDVNSGRSTKERNIEETALKTNVEAAEEIARQLRLRDLAGLIVIDFIDMEEHRNQASVERRLKEAMRNDRARIQLGRISPFGLLEMSRQRLRPSLLEASTQPCPHCNGTGYIRSTESTALHVLRALEEEGMRRRSAELALAVPTVVALYILNHKRPALQQAEAHYGFRVAISSDDSLVPPAFRLDRLRALTPAEIAALPAITALPPEPEDEEDDFSEEDEDVVLSDTAPAEKSAAPAEATDSEPSHRHRRRRRRRGEDGREHRPPQQAAETGPNGEEAVGEESAGTGDREVSEDFEPAADQPATEDGHPENARPEGERGEEDEAGERKRRRRGRRGGRRRRRGGQGTEDGPAGDYAEQSGAPQAETVELMPVPDAGDDTVEEMVEAFVEPTVPAAGAFATETIPIGEEGDLARTEESEPPHAAQPPQEPVAPPPAAPDEGRRAPAQHNAPPTVEVTGPAEKPRRGWWRR